MTSADALVLEAEGFIQSVRSRVRSEDSQFGFLEATNSHPLQDSLHQHASQADPSPSVPDRNADPTHVAGPRVCPCVAVGLTDRLPNRIRDEQDCAHPTEGAEPMPFGLDGR